MPNVIGIDDNMMYSLCVSIWFGNINIPILRISIVRYEQHELRKDTSN